MHSHQAPGAPAYWLTFVLASPLFALVGCAGQIASDDAESQIPALDIGSGSSRLPSRPGIEKTAPALPGTSVGLDPPGGGVPGAGGAGPSAPSPDGMCKGESLGAGVVRRLNRAEYNRTIEDLLGDRSRPANAFPPDAETLGFDTIADNLNVDKTLAIRLREAATSLADRATSDLSKLLGCPGVATLARADQDACLDRFIPRFGLKAWRRPLAMAEIDKLRGVFRKIRDVQGLREGVSTLLAALLESPNFLFRIEGATTAPPSQTIVRLNPYETASRLSYFVWGGMPDDELFDAAAKGALATKEQVSAQARRMLADKRSALSVERFFSHWLDLGRIESTDLTPKSPTLFASFTPAVRAGLKAETLAVTADLFWNGDSKVASFFLAGHTFLDSTLAKFYRASGAYGTDLRRAETTPGQRAGILTQGSIMAGHAHDTSSPVLRGRFVRERFLCSSPPPPPANVNVSIPPPDPKQTTRQRFERHRTDPACGGCHQLLDPIGLAFENFDAVGRWRDDENGTRIDASGEVFGTDVAGPVVGPKALSAKLAVSRQSSDCVATNWFRFALGRLETDADACALRSLKDAFATSGGDMRALIVTLTQSDAFLFRTTQ